MTLADVHESLVALITNTANDTREWMQDEITWLDDSIKRIHPPPNGKPE